MGHDDEDNNTNIDDNKNWQGALSIMLLSQRLLVLKDKRMVWLFLGSVHYLPWVWQ